MPTPLPHRRYNPLSDSWVLISPQRANRPWQSASPPQAAKAKEHDPNCYLCPGNHRSPPGGKKIQNPNYRDIFIFDNDFPALLADGPATSDTTDSPFFQSQGLNGTCRVICYSHKHNVHWGEMAEDAIAKLVQAWVAQHAELGEQYSYVQIFENRGEMVGCSSPHPHGQIWALNYTPQLVKIERQQQAGYYRKHRSLLLLDYLATEEKHKTRMVATNEDWALLVPYWAYWPYETLLVPRRAMSSLQELREPEKASLAAMLKLVVRKYARLMKRNFPYMMGWHSSCEAGGQSPGEQLHCHFYPPLLDRVKQKFTAGFEVFAELQRDLTPEQAAERLRDA